MDTQGHPQHSVVKRLSGLDRRRTLGAAIAAIGAIAVSAGLISTPATADSTFVCPVTPDGNPTYDGVLYTYDPPGSPIVEVGNWPALWVGVGVGDGSEHVLYGDGVRLMNNDVLQVLDDTGQLANDAHLCKLDTSATTTTAPETTAPETTAPETTVAESTVPETTAPESTVAETTVPETTAPETTAPESSVAATTVPETTAPEATTPTTPESSIVDSTVPTTASTVVQAPPTVPAQAPPTTSSGTVSQELPRTGTDSARALMTFGSLMMLMGGVLVLRSRRAYDFG